MTKRTNDSLELEPLIKQEIKRLAIYDRGSISNNSESDEDEPVHPNGNNMLCLFKPQTESRTITWIDKFIYNLEAQNLTVVRSKTAFNKLFECLSFLQQSLSIKQYYDQLYPEPNKNIIILKPTSPRVVFKVGMLIKGGSLPFYFFDFVKLKRFTGPYGEFFTFQWRSQLLHNGIYSTIITKFKGWDEQLKMQDIVYVNVPPASSYSNRMALVRKFFDIKREHNEHVYMTGQLCKSINCEPFTLDRFNDLFCQLPDQKCSNEVEMLVGAVIEGFKQSKDEIEYETVNNKKVQEKTFSLAVKPEIFFLIE
jgi:ssDNA binding protein